MRRNRLLYCAADVAVVVASAAERGGTRAGALEALNAGWVPILVRRDGRVGNGDLLRRGAQPLTDPVQLAEGALRVTARSPFDDPLPPPDAQRAPRSSAPVRSDSATAEADFDHDLFPAVWPQIAAFLAVPRSETDVAEYFGLQRTQARAWLARPVEEHNVRREKRPPRYVLGDGQQSISTGWGARPPSVGRH
jgi:predicted Rossmann fold nucleotide-binding protein DprA/Smf involved in DNA uptake